MSKEKSQNLMNKIALLLQEEKAGDDSAFIRESLFKINERLDKIEIQLADKSFNSQIITTKSIHPSQDKLNLIEEIVEELFHNQKMEKACMFETNKPCDNCSMCNSRGF